MARFPFDVWFDALVRVAREDHGVEIDWKLQGEYSANFQAGMTLVDAIYIGPLGEGEGA